MQKRFTLIVTIAITLLASSAIAISLHQPAHANSNTCTYVNTRDGEVRSFRIENHHFIEDDSTNITAPNSADCPKNEDGSYADLFLPSVCADCSNLSIYKEPESAGSDSALFTITDRYAAWTKYNFSQEDRITIRRNGRKTSIYALTRPDNGRTYVGLGEFCVQFGCTYGYANGDDKRSSLITISYVPEGSNTTYQVTNKIGTSEFNTFIIDATGKKSSQSTTITQDRNAKTFLYPEGTSTDKVPFSYAFRRTSIQSVDVLVPIRMLAEGLNQIVTWDGASDEARIDELSPEIRYAIDTPGNFIFVNNPEFILSEHLANNGRLYYSGNVSGNAELYFEHLVNNIFGKNFYYVLRFTNTKGGTANLNFQRCGLSKDSNWTMALKNYDKLASDTCKFSDGKTSFSIGSNQNMVFYDTGSVLTDSAKPLATPGYYRGFDGLIKFSTSGELRLDVFGFVAGSQSDAQNFPYTTTATYPGNVGGNMPVTSQYNRSTSSPLPHGLVYTGNMSRQNIATNSISFVIDDSTQPNTPLQVKVRPGDNNNQTSSLWNTNVRGIDRANIKADANNALSDVIPLQVKCEDNSVLRTIHPLYVDPISQQNLQSCMEVGGWNWANWAVHTVENIGIRNTSSKERTVSMQLFLDTANNPTIDTRKTRPYRIANSILSDSGATLTDGNGVKYIDFYNNDRPITSTNLWTIKIPAGAQAMVTSETLLGGASSSPISKQIKVTN